ncbi:MAG TPA: TIM barrel protein [Candidatus Dormibacteraeota bacterium]|nr:TIM barrel protein [Candidatus Dormibacteraeota bacterium]
MLIDPARLAAAPISWGVCEVPGWGHQMAPDRVLAEMQQLGLDATEAGPPGWFPDGPRARIVAGFVAADDLEPVERQAAWLHAHGATVLSLGAGSAEGGYEARTEPDEATWEAVGRVEDVCRRNGLTAAVHPHFGTRIEGEADLRQLLHRTRVDVCLDTGHLLLGGADPTTIPIDRVALVHLKDLREDLAVEVRARRLGYREAVARGLYPPLGRGDAPIARVIQRLERGGYRGLYVLEQDCTLEVDPPEGQGPIEDVRRSLEFLNA